jgi:hypothetical protein
MPDPALGARDSMTVRETKFYPMWLVSFQES